MNMQNFEIVGELYKMLCLIFIARDERQRKEDTLNTNQSKSYLKQQG